MVEMKAKAPLRSVPLVIQLAEAAGGGAEVPKEVQILKTGIFQHPWYGPFKIDEATLSSMVKNFSENVRGIDLAMDFEHQNMSIAAGWFTGLRVKQTNDGKQGLFADIDWTPRGAQALKDKEFRYISGEFDLEYKDSETLNEYGPTLFGAGLTNRPFLKGMAPTAQLDEGEEEMKTLAEVTKDLEALQKANEAKDAEIKSLKESLSKGAQDDAAKKLADATAEIERLKAEKKADDEAKAKAAKTAKFDEMLKKGITCEAQREAFMADDFAKFTELAQPVKLTQEGGGGSGAKVTTVKTKADAEVEIDGIANKLLSEKKASDYRSAVKLALKENPEIAKIYRGDAA